MARLALPVDVFSFKDVNAKCVIEALLFETAPSIGRTGHAMTGFQKVTVSDSLTVWIQSISSDSVDERSYPPWLYSSRTKQALAPSRL
eukprot:6432275-Pyramimonas_sp.AAC.1